MSLTNDQEIALKSIKSWLTSGTDQVFNLHGYAGTGKTELIKYAATSRTVFAAFTGKAASVMRSRGCYGAQTLHSLLYKPQPKRRDQLNTIKDQLIEEINGDRRPKIIEKLEKEYRKALEDFNRPEFYDNETSDLKSCDFVVVDEASMVDGKIGNDLLSWRKPVLAVQDPAQLPPVVGKSYFSQKPNAMLKHIVRQDKNNPIIHLSQLIRENGKIKIGSYGENCEVVRREKFDMRQLTDYQQVLCGKNKTRMDKNQKIRELIGVDKNQLIVSGDKLLCLRNDASTGTLNGTLWNAVRVDMYPNKLISISIIDENRKERTRVTTDQMFFDGTKESPYESRDYEGLIEPAPWDYGYCITVHKSQGSEWGSVAVYDESAVFRQNNRKWLYTAVTRAKDRLTLIH